MGINPGDLEGPGEGRTPVMARALREAPHLFLYLRLIGCRQSLYALNKKRKKLRSAMDWVANFQVAFP